jgi:hypothetical protein
MFSISKNFIKVNEGLFQVLKILSEERVKNADMVKEWLGADIIFRKDGNFYFCKQIQDLEYEQN